MPKIDNMAHIGGLLGGLDPGFLLMPRLTEHLTESGVVRQRTPLSWGWNGVIVLVALLFAIVALAVPAL